MFSLFSNNPGKKLRIRRKKLLEEAMRVQRSGDLKLYASKMKEVEEIENQLNDLESK